MRSRDGARYLDQINHAIRTSVNSMLGAAELLRDTSLTAEQREYVHIFRLSADRLFMLSNRITELYHAEEGMAPLDPAVFDFRELAQETAGLMWVLSREKAVALTCVVDERVPSTLFGDRPRLERALVILLRNAIRRTNSGEIRFSACCDRVSLDSATIRCEVDDDGPPVPAACLNEPFGLNIADVSEGDELTTGLDFCIARRLAESMGGRFWIENKFTGGAISHLTATFLLREPVSRTTPLIPPQRILVAEDSEDNLFLVKALLRDVPCHLNTAENGAIAVEKACSGSFDLILMDVEMPVLDGYEATRRIRIWERDNNLPPIPIVALTARTLAEEADRSAQAGCSGYLPKPVRKRTLLDVIARHCTL